MTLCDNGHEKICYELNFCPLCEANEKIDRQSQTIINYETKIEDLENEIEDLEEQIKELQNGK
jgi:chromosome segregation ATPase